MDDSKLKMALRASTPKARLEAIRIFMDELPESATKTRMAELAEQIDERLSASPGGSKALIMLGHLEGLRLEAVGNIHRQAGGKATAQEKKRAADDRIAEAAEIWQSLSERPEHERVNVIASRMKAKPNTVRDWVRKAGLR